MINTKCLTYFRSWFQVPAETRVSIPHPFTCYILIYSLITLHKDAVYHVPHALGSSLFLYGYHHNDPPSIQEESLDVSICKVSPLALLGR